MDHTFLIVGYRKLRYALDAHTVQEVVWLPELSPIEEMPSFIRGIFNLRGHVIPVLDLGLRFGYGPEPASIHDRVVVITESGHRVGIVVHELHDVTSVSDVAVEPIGNFQLPGGQTLFLQGAIMEADGLLMLLDSGALLDQAIALEPFDDLPGDCGERGEAGADEQVLHARAIHLAKIPEQVRSTDETACALIRLGGELFGVAIQAVREFVRLRELTPIPCAPPHVAGNLNLRGDILAVVDIRRMLAVSASAAAHEIAVLQIKDIPIGILAESIEDVISIRRDQLTPAPTNHLAAGFEICPQVATIDQQRVISMIDTERLEVAFHSRPREVAPDRLN